MIGRHRWKDAGNRNGYALINTPKKGWVRIFRVDDSLIVQRFHGDSFINILPIQGG